MLHPTLFSLFKSRFETSINTALNQSAKEEFQLITIVKSRYILQNYFKSRYLVNTLSIGTLNTRFTLLNYSRTSYMPEIWEIEFPALTELPFETDFSCNQFHSNIKSCC